MLDALKTALEATGLAFAHYGWSKAPEGDYGVYAEDSDMPLMLNNLHAERATVCYVNYFTRDDSGTAQAAIETAFDSIGAAWSVNTVQFEQDTGFVHIEWEVSLVD